MSKLSDTISSTPARAWSMYWFGLAVLVVQLAGALFSVALCLGIVGLAVPVPVSVPVSVSVSRAGHPTTPDALADHFWTRLRADLEAATPQPLVDTHRARANAEAVFAQSAHVLGRLVPYTGTTSPARDANPTRGVVVAAANMDDAVAAVQALLGNGSALPVVVVVRTRHDLRASEHVCRQVLAPAGATCLALEDVVAVAPDTPLLPLAILASPFRQVLALASDASLPTLAPPDRLFGRLGDDGLVVANASGAGAGAGAVLVDKRTHGATLLMAAFHAFHTYHVSHYHSSRQPFVHAAEAVAQPYVNLTLAATAPEPARASHSVSMPGTPVAELRRRGQSSGPALPSRHQLLP